MIMQCTNHHRAHGIIPIQHCIPNTSISTYGIENLIQFFLLASLFLNNTSHITSTSQYKKLRSLVIL